MNRDLIINVLLIIAGIVLAIALFGAGVLWRSKTAAKATSLMLRTWGQPSAVRSSHGLTRKALLPAKGCPLKISKVP